LGIIWKRSLELNESITTETKLNSYPPTAIGTYAQELQEEVGFLSGSQFNVLAGPVARDVRG
jgi:hypothetical protein